MEDKLEINRIKSLYQEDVVLTNIEKKFNKLLKLKVVPYINCIVNQYFLTVLGGDHYSKGLIKQSEKYIEKLDSHLVLLTNFKNSEDIIESIKLKKDNAIKLNKKISKKYEEFIQKSKIDEHSIKFNIYNFHIIQTKTNNLCNKKKDNKEHIETLKNEKKRINELIEKENDDIYLKLLESQIGVIEQQIDLLK